MPTAGIKPTFLQLYSYDVDELDDRITFKVARELNREVMSELQRELYCIDPLVQEYKAVDG